MYIEFGIDSVHIKKVYKHSNTKQYIKLSYYDAKILRDKLNTIEWKD